MWVGRTDWEGAKMFADAHVQMLAQDWGHPVPSDSARAKPRHHLRVTPRHHHRRHRPRLHAVHS